MANADTTAIHMIPIEVAYALPAQQTLLALTVPVGTTLRAAVELSGILKQHPEINGQTAVFGIFGKIEKSPDTRLLNAGDRIEIYRPLQIDPKEARRARAERARGHRLHRQSLGKI